MEGMGQFPDNYFDLAIVDPPYGIGMGGNAQIKALKSRPKWTGCKYEKKQWDNNKPLSNYWHELKRVSSNLIVWGGNYFTDYLEPKKSWIVWDKMMSHNINFSHCELAWTSFDTTLKMIKYTATGYSKEKIHPTEKPIYLYRWILINYGQAGWKIFDTHVGSGSSLIACEREGFQYVGFEIDPDYYKAAKERIKRERMQQTLDLR